MSIYIGISQAARLAAVWTKSRLTTQLLLSVSILAYSALLLERNAKINRYYDRDNPDSKPEGRDGKNNQVPKV